MQFKRFRVGILYLFFATILLPLLSNGQVNTVEFGKNRIQHKKFIWKFYQSANFNTYFNQGGLELGKFAAQVAEDELSSIEDVVEYSLQRRANLVIYNTFDDYKSSNIGLGLDWQNAGGMTKLVNNKIVLYYDGNHNTLRRQIREGIARILVDNILFGDDIGEIASNQALLDIPKWLTDGYVEYVAQPWSPEKDEDLRNVMLSGSYTKFYQFAFDKPLLAGHAFWYYIAEKYKKENVTYFLYLARLYKNLNTASQRICKKKFKEVLADFMTYEEEKYVKDLKQRKNAPRGRLSVVEETKKADFFRFQANPNPRNNSYAVVQFKKGVYSVKYVDNNLEEKTLLSYGIRTINGDINPNYPLLSWDGKGSRLLVVYWKAGKINMFVYDVVANIKRFKQEITGFDQILSVGFMLDANTILLSASKNGHSDIFTYRIDNEKVQQITNDVYDDLDPTFVSFPNRSGIIFASNRPTGDAINADTVLPSKNRFNIFMVDINNKSDFKQIAQLTRMKFADARYPMQYNVNHFTFVSEENGIANRWAGFFSTARDGLDTLYYIGDEIIRNATDKEIDSTLNAWQKSEPDSISYFQVFKDSTYTFPMTNYQSSLLETRIAGDKGQVSEVRREGDYKFLYKLRVDSVTLRKRNVNARPTDYMKKLMQEARLANGKSVVTTPAEQQKQEEKKPANNVFQNEFDDEKPATTKATVMVNGEPQPGTDPATPQQNVLAKSGLFNYKLKFNADYVLAGVSNNILINRYQPYSGALPVQLNNGSDFNWSFRVGVSDVMEDIKMVGGFRFGTNLSDKDVFFTFSNLRKRLDWGFTYYRSTTENYPTYIVSGPGVGKDNKLITNLYQVNVAYPIDETKRIGANIGLRTDRGVIRPFNYLSGQPDPTGLHIPDTVSKTGIAHLEYVYDNTINPTQNIWNGLRWKIYYDYYKAVGKGASTRGINVQNLGVDARYYVKIYRNFIWAGRAAGDFSFGDQKILYYLGGVDGWIGPKANTANTPTQQDYVYQSLTLNMRGFKQNVANGNNATVINSEFRLPVFSTFFNKPINSAFIRNFQLVQFIDLGTAWSGSIKNITRPTTAYMELQEDGTPNPNYAIVRTRAGGIGPFAGGYGFGVRTTVLGYFLKLDTAWEMNGIFKGKPMWYFALGLDF
ncbi:hypothetical protein SAMN05421788_101688 [Filimonas lacunae]|uniref:WD40-like Beta Propeller Repeat n=1 Tax=Filimonas lacunae TaxID=477680 RepID=A0A173MPF6_9BACT|nr:hypothetical protein [Filimonas lacunae]BAV09248.1 D-alanyl-D-alanine carboxypeptidase [Filimonas lacunae]SIS69741.1 hypothetical protein SAMN05421788_101688 [Filimonas lacunae]